VNEGWIYILRNPSLKKDLIKIGKTNRSPEERAKELSTHSGVPMPYEVSYKIKVRDCDRAESRIHKELKRLGYHHTKEFFHIAIEKAVEVAKECCTEMELFDESEIGDSTPKLDYYEAMLQRARSIQREDAASISPNQSHPSSKKPWMDYPARDKATYPNNVTRPIRSSSQSVPTAPKSEPQANAFSKQPLSHHPARDKYPIASGHRQCTTPYSTKQCTNDQPFTMQDKFYVVLFFVFWIGGATILMWKGPDDFAGVWFLLMPYAFGLVFTAIRALVRRLTRR